MKRFPALSFLASICLLGCGVTPPAPRISETPEDSTDPPASTELVHPAGDVDEDGDGLTRSIEATIGTSDSDSDSDDDGISDFVEWTVFRTNPTQSDTDSDGLSDSREVFELASDPLVADSDDDGLNDYDEVMVYETSPTSEDTDYDGLSDGAETYVFATDPRVADSDRDGLIDGQELALGTNANLSDSNGDGLSDKAETYGGSDPLDALDPPPPIVPGDLFSFLTQEQTDLFEARYRLADLEVGRWYALNEALMAASAASQGGGGLSQLNACSLQREARSKGIEAFEIELYELLDEIEYVMDSSDRAEVSAYMHRTFDQDGSCQISNCAFVSFLCR